jgi:hypothetical protein
MIKLFLKRYRKTRGDSRRLTADTSDDEEHEPIQKLTRYYRKIIENEELYNPLSGDSSKTLMRVGKTVKSFWVNLP